MKWKFQEKLIPDIFTTWLIPSCKFMKSEMVLIAHYQIIIMDFNSAQWFKSRGHNGKLGCNECSWLNIYFKFIDTS